MKKAKEVLREPEITSGIRTTMAEFNELNNQVKRQQLNSFIVSFLSLPPNLVRLLIDTADHEPEDQEEEGEVCQTSEKRGHGYDL